MSYMKVIDFWFKEIPSSMWFKKDKGFDNSLRNRFQEEYDKATKGELVEWRKTIQGCLAEIILLDQFSRNMYRNDPRAFAQDGMALVLAQEAIKHHDVSLLTTDQVSFLYMPFMHSESLVIHEKAMEYFNQEGLEYSFKIEKEHRDILLKFGRYPHRNKILGRNSTPEEVAFLKQPGSSF